MFHDFSKSYDLSKSCIYHRKPTYGSSLSADVYKRQGLPHNELAAQIVRQAKISNASGEDNFAIVFAAIGVKHDEADYFREEFNNAGVDVYKSQS